MGAKGFHLPSDGHTVQITAAVDINGAIVNSDVFSMANHSHVDILVGLGVTGAATTITVEECDDFVPTNTTAIAFAVYKEETAGGDTLGARVAATTAGFAASTNNGIFYIISIDASQLSDGRPNLRIAFSDPSAATVASAFAILSGSRFAGDQNATAIA